MWSTLLSLLTSCQMSCFRSCRRGHRSRTKKIIDCHRFWCTQAWVLEFISDHLLMSFSFVKCVVCKPQLLPPNEGGGAGRTKKYKKMTDSQLGIRSLFRQTNMNHWQFFAIRIQICLHFHMSLSHAHFLWRLYWEQLSHEADRCLFWVGQNLEFEIVGSKGSKLQAWMLWHRWIDRRYSLNRRFHSFNLPCWASWTAICVEVTENANSCAVHSLREWTWMSTISAKTISTRLKAMPAMPPSLRGTLSALHRPQKGSRYVEKMNGTFSSWGKMAF